MTPTIDKAFEAQLKAAGLGSLVDAARAQQEHAAEDLRRAAGERLGAAEREWPEGERKIDAELAKLHADADAQAQRLATTRARIGELEGAKLQLGSRMRRTINDAIAALRANPPAAIVAAREQLEAFRDTLRNERVQAEHDENGPNGTRRVVVTNQYAIQRRADAVQRALWTLHELEGVYTPADKLSAKVAAVLAAIPNGFAMPTPAERIPPRPAKRAA